MLFYSGEEVWAASGKPAPNSREEEGCGLAWEWKEEREAIQSTIPFPHCLPAQIWIRSLKADEKNASVPCIVGFLSLLFYLQLNAFQMEQLYRKHFW